MFVPEEMKLNKFREVAIPSNADYFSRYGQRAAPDQSFTGDELAVGARNKVDVLADMDERDQQLQREEAQKASKSEE